MKTTTIALSVCMMTWTASAFAQNATMMEETPGLLRKAKVTAEAATASARAQVPQGAIISAEIEKENGKLIFSFDIRTEAKPGIDEVAVDAITGKVLSVQHETPVDEAKEKAADKKKR